MAKRGFLLKRRKDDASASEEQTDQTQDTAVERPAKGKAKKPKRHAEKMASVISETVPQAAVDDLRNNTAFVLPDEQSWAVLVLAVDTEEFGGLSQKSSKNPDKGMIVKLIENNDIRAITTDEMLNADNAFLGFIPTKQTLDAMSEFSLLKKQHYYWGVVTSNEQNSEIDIKPAADAKFDDAVAIANGMTTLANVAPEVWNYGNPDAETTQAVETIDPAPAQAAPETDETDTEDVAESATEAVDEPAQPEYSTAPAITPTPEDDEDMTATSPEETQAEAVDAGLVEPDDGVDYGAMEDDADDDPFADDADDNFDDGPVEPLPEFDENADADAVPVAEEAAVGGFVDEGEFVDDEDADGVDDDGGYGEYTEQYAGQEIHEDQVRDVITRRLLSGDLDLDIDLTAFYQMFADGSQPNAFDVSDAVDSESWLGQQVSQLARQANSELRRMRSDHLSELRESYLDFMNQQVETIAAQVDDTKEGSQYYDLMVAARREREEQEQSAEHERAARTKEMQERFFAEADAKGEAARETARSNFISRNSAMQEERISNIGREIEQRIEDTHAERETRVHDLRRRDASRRMDFGVAHVLKMLSERHQEQRALEAQAMDELNEKILKFIDENRKHDIARAEALEEQLRQDVSLDKLRASHADEMKRLQEQLDDQVAKAQTEVQRVSEAADAELRHVNAQWEQRLQGVDHEWKYKYELVEGQRDNALHEVQSFEELRAKDREKSEKEYNGLWTLYQQEKERNENAAEENKNTGRVWMMLMIAVGLALALAGFLLGFSL